MLTVTPENLSSAVLNELKNYDQAVQEMVKKNIRTVAKETAKELKSSSPKKTGEYASHWSTKNMYENSMELRVAVYNRAPTYRLTHLLENGHAKVGGGRVSGRKHILPAEQNAIKKLTSKVKVGIRHC